MKRLAVLGVCTLSVLLVLIGFVVSRHYLAARGDVGLPVVRLAPPLPPSYEYVQNCERVQQILANSPSGEPVLKTAFLSEDEIAIYKVILDSWDSRGPINLSRRTLPLDRDISKCECLAGIDPASIIGASNTFRILRRETLRIRNVRLVDPDTQNSIVQANDPERSTRQGKSVPAAVDRGFASGLFSLSEIAFNKDQSRALVSYSFHCGSLCGSGRTLVLEKFHGVWKENSDHTCAGWIS